MRIYPQTKKITHNVKHFDRKFKFVCKTRCLPKTQPFRPLDRKQKTLSFVRSPNLLQILPQENVSLTFLFHHHYHSTAFSVKSIFLLFNSHDPTQTAHSYVPNDVETDFTLK